MPQQDTGNFHVRVPRRWFFWVFIPAVTGTLARLAQWIDAERIQSLARDGELRARVKLLEDAKLHYDAELLTTENKTRRLEQAVDDVKRIQDMPRPVAKRR